MIATLVTVPFLIGFILIITSQSASTTSMILIGVGTALPAAYHLVMIWLVGAKGFTLGKLILGLRVTRLSEGGALSFVRALGRWAVYALFPLLMALSIFFDPRKLLRGFHDRAIDSVVADIKAGRNPLQPRPDDFERAGAEHYLGAPSVAAHRTSGDPAPPGAIGRGPRSLSTEDRRRREPRSRARRRRADGGGPAARGADPVAAEPVDGRRSRAASRDRPAQARGAAWAAGARPVGPARSAAQAPTWRARRRVHADLAPAGAKNRPIREGAGSRAVGLGAAWLPSPPRTARPMTSTADRAK